MYPVKLIRVTEDNHNEFYKITPKDNGMFLAEYGRVEGGHIGTKEYAESEFEKKLREKIRKGYRDVTELFAEGSTKTLAGISNAEVAQLIDQLQSFAKAVVDRSYSISAASVTKAQIDEAQAILDRLAAAVPKKNPTEDEVATLNKILLELFAVLPRKMKKVADYLIQPGTSLQDLDILITKEQDVLDALASQVSQNTAQDSEEDTSKSILDALGMKLAPVSDSAVISKIKVMMGPNSHQFRKAYEVVLSHTEAKFKAHLGKAADKTTQLFWHGSRNENWWSILQKGLLIRPAGSVISGSMFGYGVYFAPKFQKSLGYTSLSGSYWAGGSSNKAFLAVMEVHTGRSWKIFDKDKNWHGSYGSLDYKEVSSKGYDSVHAEAGINLRNDEIIVYQESQSTIRYLVEVGN